MATKISPIALDLLKLPIGVILGAHAIYNGKDVLGGTPADMKSRAVFNLTALIESGALTISDVARCTPASVATPNVAQQADTLAVAAVANRAEQSALDAHQLLVKVKGALHEVATRLKDEKAERVQGLEDIKDGINKLSTKVEQVKVDDRKVEEAVAKVVADAFAPFKAAVEAAGAQAVVADLSSVHVVETKTCLDVFGVNVRDRKGDPLTVDIWNDPSAPAIDPNFIWTEAVLDHLILSQITGENVWFGGPKGTGKSETARQFAAYTGRAFKRINFHKYTSAEDYIGAVGLENGQTVFKRGDFLSAFTHPSTVILLDEVTNADPGELAPLNGFLEPNSAVSFGGAVQRRAPGVLVFAADNTLGNGDDSGRYAGTRAMNSALVDRFARVVQFDYLPLSSEVEAVVRHTGCDAKLAEHIMVAVGIAREKVQTGEVIDAPSIRSVIAFVRALQVLPIDKAWATTIAARQPAESLPGLTAIYLSAISEETINKYL
jgi:MoxR-like ATPase